MRGTGVVSTACDSGVLEDELELPGVCATTAGAATSPPTSNATAAVAIGNRRAANSTRHGVGSSRRAARRMRSGAINSRRGAIGMVRDREGSFRRITIRFRRSHRV